MDILSTAEKLFDDLGLQDKADDDATTGGSVPHPLPKDVYGIVDASKKEGIKELGLLKGYVADCEGMLPDFSRARRAFEDQYRKDEPSLSGAGTRYKSAADQLERARVNLRKFKQRNDLERDVLNDDRKVQLMWAVVIIVVEGLLNTLFFKDLSAGGFIGGFQLAFMVSFVNVSFAFAGGAVGLRFLMNHVSAARQVGGALVFTCCIAASLFTVSMVSFFRAVVSDAMRVNDAKAVGEQKGIADLINDSWREALNRFAELPDLGMFATLDSFLLFFVGIICAMLGVWKGYEYDDPYPGYGPMWRTIQEAEDAADDAKEDYDKTVSDARLRLDSLREGLRELAVRLTELQELIRRNFYDPASEPAAYKLDGRLQKLANETYSLYHHALRKLVSAPSEIKPVPDADEWPGEAFRDFTADNFNCGHLARVYKDAAEAIEAAEEIRLRGIKSAGAAGEV